MMTVRAERMAWLPWRRKADRLSSSEVRTSDQRLKESEELRRRAKRVEKSMNGHRRRNRFGEMLDDEVFGSDE